MRILFGSFGSSTGIEEIIVGLLRLGEIQNEHSTSLFITIKILNSIQQ